jgi:ATP-dependent helicase/nuclease subunit A
VESPGVMNRHLIRASAGSGKTYQLSGHFLKQLFLGQRPETILATTFTRKAAGEILGRVLLRLALAAEDSRVTEDLRQSLGTSRVTQQSALQLLVEVTRDLHRMRVCTLDSFFQLLARSLTLELGLQPGWSIIDEHVDRELRQQAIDAVLSQHVSRDAQQLMQMLARGRSKRSVRDLIDETVTQFYELFLLTDQAAWLQFPKHRRLTRQEMDEVIEDLRRCDLPADKRAATARENDIGRFLAGQWEGFVTTGLAATVVSGTAVYYGKPLPDALIQVYERLLSHARAELVDQLAQQTKATWELISRYDHEYSRLRAEHGWMRFSDVTRVLARSDDVADGRRMSFRLDSTIRHLLLDEFQDTSPDQWRILRRLALSIVHRPGDTSFFCVGDGKQAIYGWRGGESAILDAVEATIPDLHAAPLDKSRRSSPAVIETVNRLFQHLLQHGNLDDYHEACARWCQLFPPHSTALDKMPGFVQLRTSPGWPETRRSSGADRGIAGWPNRFSGCISSARVQKSAS